MANTIHSTAIIEDGVVLGDNNIIEAYSVIKKGTTIGNNNRIESFTTIGAYPSTDVYSGVPSGVTIGSNNIIGANTVIQKGLKILSKTTIGDSNTIFNNVTIGHDCVLGNFNLMNAYVGLTGGIKIGNHVTFCPFSGVGISAIEGVSSTAIDSYSFISTYSRVSNNVPMLSNVIGGYNPVSQGILADKLKIALLDYPEETEASIKAVLEICSTHTSNQSVIDALDKSNNFQKHLINFYQSHRNIIKRK